MLHSESLYPRDWFRIGRRDLNRARLLFGVSDLEGAAFYCQQAAEKHLKGYLLAQNWRLRRIHDLELLLNDAVAHQPEFERYRAQCQKITQYYIEDRYPFTVASPLTKDEVSESMNAADAIIAYVISLVGD